MKLCTDDVKLSGSQFELQTYACVYEGPFIFYEVGGAGGIFWSVSRKLHDPALVTEFFSGDPPPPPLPSFPPDQNNRQFNQLYIMYNNTVYFCHYQDIAIHTTISRENECFTTNFISSRCFTSAMLTVLYFIIGLEGKMRKKIQKSNSSVTEMKIE